MAGTFSFTPLELRRHRSDLSADEVRVLLALLPVMLDRRADCPAHLGSAVRIEFLENTPASVVTNVAVTSWLPFRLVWDDNISASAEMTPDRPAHLAALIVELLGDTGCDEGTDRVLEKARTGGAFASCAEFWSELLAQLPDDRSAFRVPEWVADRGAPATKLLLAPQESSTPILLVARPRFLIGRSADHADFITCILPETEENDERTNLLGRVHVFGEALGGEATLRDGNGTEQSMNGSIFDGRALSVAPTALRRRATLSLGEHYSVVVIPYLDACDDIRLDDPRAVRDADAPRGAIVFGPAVVQPLVIDAAWLFTRLDFTLRPSGGPAWLAPSPENPARFLHRGGIFWLVNLGFTSGQLGLGERVIGVGEAVPLDGSLSLRLGARVYSIGAE